ncbi:MAG: hypothetical protein JNM93_04450 [Bacteriovoracaceae bacterium]|nr:hypothetical protein [Bacteriovoracaceae bacterium]
MDKKDIQKEREFLHHIINLITRAHGRTKINCLKIKTNQNIDPKDLLENSEKTLEALDELTVAINNHRLEMLNEASFEPDAEIPFDIKKFK